MREIVRAEAWSGFRELVEEIGGDPAEILAAAHVDEASLAYPDRYLPLRSLVDSIEIAARRLGRKDFGLLSGSRSSLSMLGALTIAASNSPSGREGFETVARYVHIHNPSLTISISPVPRATRDFISIELKSRTFWSAKQYLERGVSVIHSGLRMLCGPGYLPVEVRFRNEQMSPLAVYRKVFGVDPSFGEPAMGVVVDRATINAYHPGRNARLRELSEAYLQSLGAPHDDTLSWKVAGVVRGLLSNGDCTSEQAARALGVHERTLQRRLQAEDTSFEQIKDDVRREMAEGLLGQPGVSLTHIAYILSYADSSVFSRSARRWFGMSPSDYRARLLAAPGAASRDAPVSRATAREAVLRSRGEERLPLGRRGRPVSSRT